MTSRWFAALMCLAGLGLVALLAGCGGSVLGPMPGKDTNTADTTVPLREVPGVLYPRWMDVLDNLYSLDFRSTFSHGTSTVSATYPGSTQNPVRFQFDTAAGLKRHFAYQVKLEGQDTWTNSTLTKLGRSWGSVGYLIFGYVVTDATGRVAESADGQLLSFPTVRVNSSYHVLWKTSQRARTRSDGPAVLHAVDPTATPGLYDSSTPIGGTVGIYGEWEPGKPKPGALALPAGTYRCLLRLTEESFHSTDSNGGGWESVLDAPVTFRVTGRVKARA